MQKFLKEEIKYLQRILSENSNSVLFARLSDAYLQTDRVDDAIELCEAGVKNHPMYVTGHFILGKCYLKKKLFDQAEKEFKRVIFYDPKYIAAHREYGELMAQIGWHTTSDMTYEEIIKIDPINEKAKIRLAELKKQYFPQQVSDEKSETKFEIKEIENNSIVNSKSIQEETEIKEEKIDDFDLTANIPEKQVEADNPGLTPDISNKHSEVDNFGLPSDISEKQSETNKFDLPPAISEKHTEVDKMDNLDENDASMDLLEDIFRDNSIPDLGSDEQFNLEETINKDKEAKLPDTAEDINAFKEPTDITEFESPHFHETKEQLSPENKIKQNSEPEPETPVKESTIAEEPTEMFEPEPSPFQNLENKSFSETTVDPKNEQKSEISPAEQTYFDKFDQLQESDTFPGLEQTEYNTYPDKTTDQSSDAGQKSSAENNISFEDKLAESTFEQSFPEPENLFQQEESRLQDIDSELKSSDETQKDELEASTFEQSFPEPENLFQQEEKKSPDINPELISPVETQKDDDPSFGFFSENENNEFDFIPKDYPEEKAKDNEISIEKPQVTSDTVSEQIPIDKNPIEQKIDTEPKEIKEEKIVTPTLGEIYTSQHQYSKAISVFELLMKKDPNNEFYKQKIDYLRKKIEESQNEE